MVPDHDVTFIVPGMPKGKERPRTYWNDRHGQYETITPKKTKDYEALVRDAYAVAGGRYLGERPIFMTVTAFYKIPKSVSAADRQKMLAGTIRPTVTPDVDNCVKAICDGLNGIAYKDDKQVVSCMVSKVYGETPRVEVEIWTEHGVSSRKGNFSDVV